MNEPSSKSPPIDLGIYNRADHNDVLDPADKIAIFLSVFWLVMCLFFFAFLGLGGQDELGPLKFLVIVLALLLPVALIWIASIATKSARIMREESERLQASMDAMRQVYITQAQMAATTMGPNVERKIDEIVRGQQRTESAFAQVASTRVETQPSPARRAALGTPGAAPELPIESQPDLALGTSQADSGTPVSTADFISAMNFPETAEDREGFEALRRALSDRRAANLITASQDVLTLLSQDGIYMDDLAPDRAHPDLWRRFAIGERGGAVSALGGIRDRSSIALSAARMRQDSIFRDTTHHFLRTFDKTLAEIADDLSDQELIAAADTRTARAFMLLGRVAGMFD